MSHRFTPREVALLMAREIDHQESAPDDDEYIGDWVPKHSCGGSGDPTCAACWMHSYDRSAGAVAEEPEWEYGNEQLMHSRVEVFPASSEALAKAQAWLWPVRRRRKAGPWVPVEQEGAETDA